MVKLHSAAKGGHLDICKFILENIQEDKNPADNVGFTALHYAAIFNNLELFKLILHDVENAIPNFGSGFWTLFSPNILPYHCALYLEHKEIRTFIEEKYGFKVPNNKMFVSDYDKIKINISYQKALGQNLMPLTSYKLALSKEAFALSEERGKMLKKSLAENKKSLAKNHKLLVNAK